MSYEFTADEIKEAVSGARIYSPGYTEEQFQASTEMVKRLPESGYLGAVGSVAKLEREMGIHCDEALDSCRELSQKKAKLEQKVADLGVKLGMVNDEVRQAQDRLRQLEETTKQVKAERQKEEVELVAFRKKADKQERRIDKEVDEYRQRANVTKEEAVIAGQIKAQVESYGFSLELALKLSQEFAGCENAREALAKAIEEHGTLTQSNAALIEQGKAQKEALEVEINKLKLEKDGGQDEIESLEQTRHQMENILSQLQADVDHEKELRGFYHRYQSTGWLMEYLAGWREIYFVHCNNPVYAVTGAFNQRAGGAHFCTEKPPIRRCPCCDYPDAVFDLKFYRTFNLEPGTPVKVELGE